METVDYYGYLLDQKERYDHSIGMVYFNFSSGNKALLDWADVFEFLRVDQVQVNTFTEVEIFSHVEGGGFCFLVDVNTIPLVNTVGYGLLDLFGRRKDIDAHISEEINKFWGVYG